jgi:NADH-quinone oxidoreductase subunit N
MTLPTPSIEYFLLSPMLIVFGVAVAGVLVEAFVPRRLRYGVQVTLTFAGLVAAFVAVLLVADTIWAGRPAVLGAVAIDPTTLFLQGTVLLVAMLAVIFMAERTDAVKGAVKAATAKVAVTVGGGLDSFTPQASAVPGSDAEREAQRAGAAQTELFPLVMLSVGGMMVFPASNDLLTMFVALEVLSLPLYLIWPVTAGCCRRKRR